MCTILNVSCARVTENTNMPISRTNIIILVLVVLALALALFVRFADNDGFVQDASDETSSESSEYKDLIRVTSPLPGSTVSSPLTITGEARGNWFFEATFPVVVVNWDGLIIGEGFAEATDEWMTEEYVPFKATITFDADTTVSDRGSIILQKSNASGLPEHDDAFEYVVKLAPGTGAVAPAPSVQGAGSKLTDTSWEWVRTDRTTGADTEAPAGKFVITFGADGTASSATDCNSMSGPYSIDGESLSFGPMMSTLMFCENSVETYYSGDLEQVSSFVVDGEQLKMNLQSGGTMHFKRN